MKFFIILILFITTGTSACFADQLVECRGTNIWNHNVVAKVFCDARTGRIVMEDNVDSVESNTSIEGIGTDTLKIFDNDFVMEFSVTSGQETSPVQAFLQGAFFVEDFTCIRTD